jgi:hypothetical protein
MKRKIYSAAALLLLVCMLCACSSGKSAKTPEMQVVADAVGASIDISDMSQIPDEYVENIMGIALDGYVSRNTLMSAVGTNINEYGIFLAKDADQAKTIKDALNAYLEYRESVWMDEYLPDEKPKLDNAEVLQQGSYVMYTILSDADRDAVNAAFEGCFEG